MNGLKVKTHYLVEGCILAQDITSMTNRPIMLKKTVITNDLLEVLRAFLITEVSVEKTLVDGKTYVPKEIIDDEQEGLQQSTSFTSQYLNAVQIYKRLFTNWEAGSPVDITKVREFLIPLLEKALENQKEIFLLHHYSTKEDYFYHHAVSVGLLSGFIGKKLNMDKGDIVQLTLSGCLSDVGMSKISPTVFKKKTSLTYQDFEEIKKHPIFGYQMLQNNPFLKDYAKLAVLQHHERINGTGYPKGLNGKDLHLFSKIIAVADVYHAMTSERVYRKKHSPFKVLEMIMRDDFGKFDVKVLKALTSGLANFTIGNKVKLSNGYLAEIIFIDSHNPTRPLVKVIDTNTIIDLAKQCDIYIDEILI